MMDTLASLQSVFSTLWVVWFFVLFTGLIVWTMAPWRKREWERAGTIPFRDGGADDQAAPARGDARQMPARGDARQMPARGDARRNPL